jgi:hypothetical protein
VRARARGMSVGRCAPNAVTRAVTNNFWARSQHSVWAILPRRTKRKDVNESGIARAAGRQWVWRGEKKRPEGKSKLVSEETCGVARHVG